MKIQDHILFSIDAFQRKEKEHALLHACFAIDGTARKLYKLKQSTKKHYLDCLRKYYWLLSAFIGGLDLNTKFNHVPIENDKGEVIQSNPDIAEIIYYVFRCNSAHAHEIPTNYGLVEAKDGKTTWGFGKNRIIYIPETIIWALLAVSVFSKANTSITSDKDYYLSYQGQKHKRKTIFPIKDYWGEEKEVKQFLKDNPPKLVILDNLEKFI